MPSESTGRHTPTPWTTPGNCNIVGADGSLVCPVPRPKGPGATERRNANADLIVAAVNAITARDTALDAMRGAAERLCDEVEQAHRDVGNGFDTLASASWDVIRRNATTLRAALAASKGEGEGVLNLSELDRAWADGRLHVSIYRNVASDEAPHGWRVRVGDTTILVPTATAIPHGLAKAMARELPALTPAAGEEVADAE